MTRFLTANTRTALLADLAAAGFVWTDESGGERIPDAWEVAENGSDAAIYLGKIVLVPAVCDADGNEIEPAQISPKWHANVSACIGIVFATEQEPPQSPINVFA